MLHSDESRFSVEFFRPTVLINSAGESFSASLSSGTEKVCIIERGGEYQGFRRKNFVSQCRQNL